MHTPEHKAAALHALEALIFVEYEVLECKALWQCLFSFSAYSGPNVFGLVTHEIRAKVVDRVERVAWDRFHHQSQYRHLHTFILTDN